MLGFLLYDFNFFFQSTQYFTLTKEQIFQKNFFISGTIKNVSFIKTLNA